jgi:thiol:disulfide interchange protein DsbC
MRRSLLLAGVVGLALASPTLPASAQTASPPQLDKARVESAIPNVKVRSIKPVPLQGGLFEVIDEQGGVFYLDAGAKIGFQCDIFDVATRRNLTEESVAHLNAVDFDQLPADLAIKRVKGNGQRRLAVFADPDCPFCTRLEQSLEQIDNVSIYTYLYPIESLHPGAMARADRIWCSTDPDASWRGWLLEQRDAPAIAGECASPTAKIAELAPRFRVNGTPSLIFGSGRIVYGNVSRELLEEYLDEASIRTPTAPAGPAAGR